MNLYDKLGVKKTSKKEEIKQAFREKAKKAHPDVGGSEEEFKELNRIFRILFDDKLRLIYDLSGEEKEQTIDNAEQQAMNLLSNELISIINHYKQQVVQRDIIAEMTEKLQLTINQTAKQIKDIEGATKEITKIKNRLKMKRGRKAPFLINTLDGEINRMKVEAINLGIKIEILEKAVMLLGDYIFESDAPIINQKEAEFITFRSIKFTDQSTWRTV